MILTHLDLQNTRAISNMDLDIGSGITVVWGRNGVGKTTVLETVYYCLTGSSFRTSNERELIRDDSDHLRIKLLASDLEDRHVFELIFERSKNKSHRVNGMNPSDFVGESYRPMLGVFSPDRLDVIKGAPGKRRSHLDEVMIAIWPAKKDLRSKFISVLQQRNALLSRGRMTSDRTSWDREYADKAIALTSARMEIVDMLSEKFTALGKELGLDEARIEYRPSIRSSNLDTVCGHLSQSLDNDIQRGYTTMGPHRDDLEVITGDRSLRKYGSQGEQRAALLSLLLAERELLSSRSDTSFVLLLDDVMSELDSERRVHLMERISHGGQAIITSVDINDIPSGFEILDEELTVR